MRSERLIRRKVRMAFFSQRGSNYIHMDIETCPIDMAEQDLTNTTLISQVSHKKHKFAFGSVVSDEHILNPSYIGYQNLFYEFFNWATVGTYKWKYNEGNRVDILSVLLLVFCCYPFHPCRPIQMPLCKQCRSR